MTRRQFDLLYVGSIVHLLNCAYRVIAINPPRGRLDMAKMPESVYPDDVIRDVGYRKLTYVDTQKPPAGEHFWDERDAF